MTKPELLCPAGNMEALKAAIHNGADAIYLSGKNFGARKFAQNFSDEELTEAFSYAHLYGVKVYVTVNTIIYESETDELINYLKYLYINGADAVIMQDIGMITLAREIFPNLEIHVSTQSNNCNDEVLKLYKQLGITRVVLARELSLEEINGLETDIEKEVFIHGALCICYSGCCLFSSLNGGRSGNRGQCAGPCRLPYTLVKNGKPVKTDGNFLISTKELNTSGKIDDLLNSNIQSLKIEGRMKSPEYVGFVTKMYRNLIDKTPQTNSQKDLKKLFNREFTEGHLFHNKNENLMNIQSPNHIGIPIGEVIKINKKIAIKLTDDLNQSDGIRFKKSNKGMIVNKLYNQKGLLINKAAENDIIYLDNKIGLTKKDTVLKTIDYNLSEHLKQYSKIKIPLNISVSALIDQKLVITMDDGQNKITKIGPLVESSLTSPISKEKISNQLSKLGNTPFYAKKIKITMDDNIFISIKVLNELRRNIIDKLIDCRCKITRTVNGINLIKKQVNHKNKINLNAFVNCENQLKALLGKVDNIYTDDYKLYLKYKDNNIFYRISRVNPRIPDLKGENLLLTELGSVNKYPQNNNCRGDYFLNVVNSYSCNFLKSKGVDPITLSPEMTIEQIKNSAKYADNLEVIIYGTLELMIMNHCIIDMTENCPSCQTNKYHLKNSSGDLFPIVTKSCKTHIMQHEKLNLIDQINTLKQLGINNFRIELFNETDKETLNILNDIKKAIN